ncbi:MAG: transposase [Spirochaetia bacterium]|nr:transposase [Spirochaetia bacterium]
MLKALLAMGLLFIGPVKSNRKFIYRGRIYHAKDFIHLSKGSRYSSFVVSCGWHSSLRLIVFRRKLSSEKVRYEILLTNDLTSSSRKIAHAYLRRWNIETTFLAFKQSFALNHFHNLNLFAIFNHIALAFCALLIVANA